MRRERGDFTWSPQCACAQEGGTPPCQKRVTYVTLVLCLAAGSHVETRRPWYKTGYVSLFRQRNVGISTYLGVTTTTVKYVIYGRYTVCKCILLISLTHLESPQPFHTCCCISEGVCSLCWQSKRKSSIAVQATFIYYHIIHIHKHFYSYLCMTGNTSKISSP